jgi:hypothetical protein
VLCKRAVGRLFSSAPLYVLQEICIQHVLRDHPLGIEERTTERDGGTHHGCIGFGLSIKHWQNDVFEFVVKGGKFLVLPVWIPAFADGRSYAIRLNLECRLTDSLCLNGTTSAFGALQPPVTMGA